MTVSPIPNQPEKTKITIKRHQQSAQYFTEKLSDQVSMQMMLILGGEFLMGAPETELDSRDSERPQHEVTVPTFFMGRYPVTQEQWRVVAGFPQVNRELNPDSSYFKGDKRPVEKVSWYDAVEFCQRLSQHTGREYRLPSEAEWEYACRAGTTTPFYFGEAITTELANYNGNYTYAKGVKGEYRQETTPVDKFGVANDFALCDMHGNVWEWCKDDWHDNYKGAPTDGSAWVAKKSNTRVMRGGSWIGNPYYCRSASRYDVDAEDVMGNDVGFRVVCEVPIQ